MNNTESEIMAKLADINVRATPELIEVAEKLEQAAAKITWYTGTGRAGGFEHGKKHGFIQGVVCGFLFGALAAAIITAIIAFVYWQ